MKIGLIDVDTERFPNLALMKLSAWHKLKGDQVEMIHTPMDAMINHYDRVYKSKVFTFTQDEFYNINTDELVIGGTGYDLENKLPNEIEHIFPDYDLYPQYDYAVGFLTRGCPRNCGFCIVGKKEGLKSYKVANLSEFWNGQKEIKILDPNLLACKDKYELLQQLIDSKASVEINQGFDIRFMTERVAIMINELDLKMIHFAWDNYEFKTYDKLKKFRPILDYGKRKLIVYVLVNFNTTIDQDLERIYKLKQLEYSPYIMIYNKDKLPQGHIYKKMQRWVNNRYIWYSGQAETFEDYLNMI